MERSELPEIHHVHVGHVLDQLLSHLVVAVGTGVVKRNQPSDSWRRVSVCERERERGEWVSVCEREGEESEWVCVCERERERRVSGCVCGAW